MKEQTIKLSLVSICLFTSLLPSAPDIILITQERDMLLEFIANAGLKDALQEKMRYIKSKEMVFEEIASLTSKIEKITFLRNEINKIDDQLSEAEDNMGDNNIFSRSNWLEQHNCWYRYHALKDILAELINGPAPKSVLLQALEDAAALTDNNEKIAHLEEAIEYVNDRLEKANAQDERLRSASQILNDIEFEQYQLIKQQLKELKTSINIKNSGLEDLLKQIETVTPDQAINILKNKIEYFENKLKNAQREDSRLCYISQVLSDAEYELYKGIKERLNKIKQ